MLIQTNNYSTYWIGFYFICLFFYIDSINNTAVLCTAQEFCLNTSARKWIAPIFPVLYFGLGIQLNFRQNKKAFCSKRLFSNKQKSCAMIPLFCRPHPFTGCICESCAARTNDLAGKPEKTPPNQQQCSFDSTTPERQQLCCTGSVPGSLDPQWSTGLVGQQLLG